MYLRLLPGVAALLILAGDATAQCVNGQCSTSGPVRSFVAAIPRPHLAVSAGFTRTPMFADGPVRMLWRTRPHVAAHLIAAIQARPRLFAGRGCH